MPRRPDLPCAECGALMWRGTGSLPEGEARCRPCRAQLPHCGTQGAYKRGCRCQACRDGNAARMREYVARVIERDGLSPKQKSKPAKRRQCGDCGKVMRAGGTARIPRCQPCLIANRAAERRAATRRRRLEDKAERSATGTRGVGVWVAGVCANCSSPFARKGAVSRYCSKQCSRQDRPKGNRFKIRPTVRLGIYERDNWICQLCLSPVDPQLHHLDDWAASLDHIECQAWALIPDHSPSNLRLAHRWCNSVRGDESHYTEGDLREPTAA